MTTKKYIGLVYCLFCLFMLGYFYVLLLFPPIVTAAVYTMMAAIVYRSCYKIFDYKAAAAAGNKAFAFSLVCGAIWPLYFFFGACMFLRRALNR